MYGIAIGFFLYQKSFNFNTGVAFSKRDIYACKSIEWKETFCRQLPSDIFQHNGAAAAFPQLLSPLSHFTFRSLCINNFCVCQKNVQYNISKQFTEEGLTFAMGLLYNIVIYAGYQSSWQCHLISLVVKVNSQRRWRKQT